MYCELKNGIIHYSNLLQCLKCADSTVFIFKYTNYYPKFSVIQAVVPQCFKTTTIRPVTKTATASELKDYSPVALTPIIMKCFGQLVLSYIKNQFSPQTGPTTVCIPLKPINGQCDLIGSPLSPIHLDQRNAHIRMLFIDFSSDFNTVIPHELISKVDLRLSTYTYNRILDFLTGRPKTVQVGKYKMSCLTVFFCVNLCKVLRTIQLIFMQENTNI